MIQPQTIYMTNEAIRQKRAENWYQEKKKIFVSDILLCLSQVKKKWGGGESVLLFFDKES